MNATPPPTKTGQPRLSEVTRHLVLPTDIVSTGWPAVREKCRDLSLGFDRWQDGAGRCILAKRESGLYAAGVGGVVLSIPRQVGKTYLIGAIVFALCLIFPGLTVLWTAHRVKTSKEVFRSMQGMAKRKKIAPFIESVTRGSGDQGVEFTNGSRIIFGARETGFGRGIPGVSLVILDEAQILSEDTMDDMVPATNTAANPLVILVGTPPKPTDAGEVFANLRAAALSDDPDPDTLYIEISADPECDPESWPAGFVDFEQVARANPSYPLRTPKTAILRMFKLLGKASFRREGLGIWDEAVRAGGVITSGTWAALKDDSIAIGGAPVLALDVSPMLTHTGIVAAGPSGDGRTAIEVTSNGSLLDYREGTQWAVELLTSTAEDRGSLEVWIAEGSAAETLTKKLADGGVTVRPLGRAEYSQACVAFAGAVASKSIVHRGQKDLDRAVIAGAKRAADEGLWTWGRVKSSADITLLVAATVAVAGANDLAEAGPNIW